MKPADRDIVGPLFTASGIVLGVFGLLAYWWPSAAPIGMVCFGIVTACGGWHVYIGEKPK